MPQYSTILRHLIMQKDFLKLPLIWNRIRPLLFFALPKQKFTATMTFHSECRNRLYLVNVGDPIPRLYVPDEMVSWRVPWRTYNPFSYTLPGLSEHPWADPEIGSPGFSPTWNAVDVRGLNRESLFSVYSIDSEGCPLNPNGRTGLRGRGRLGRWGPNHAVDALVTRWKTSASGERVINPKTEYPVLQLILIKRRDTGEWALPGGMVDEGELTSVAVRREFFEEALNIPDVVGFFDAQKGSILEEFFNNGEIVYKGYVDDPRNTDNAWMETTAYLFHDPHGHITSRIELEAGDDATKAQWVDVSKELRLYASHAEIIKDAVSGLGASW